MKKVMTLCYVLRGGDILLGLKKRRLGKGLWNGFGGNVEAGETIEEAATREVFEESGLRLQSLEKIGILEFESEERKNELLEVHVFKTYDFEGEPIETDEMSPKWFSIDALPIDDMWSSDPYWFSHMIDGKKFEGKFLFVAGDAVLRHKVTVIDNF